MEFKDKLKELRIQKGISQYELAEKLFVSRSAIAKWESGNGIPSDVNLEAICEFFGVEEEWLLDRKDMKEMVENLDKKNIMFFLNNYDPKISDARKISKELRIQHKNMVTFPRNPYVVRCGNIGKLRWRSYWRAFGMWHACHF